MGRAKRRTPLLWFISLLGGKHHPLSIKTRRWILLLDRDCTTYEHPKDRHHKREESIRWNHRDAPML